MLPLIYTTPAYTITFVAAIVLTRVPEIALTYRFRSRRDPAARQVDGGSFALMSVIAGGGVIAGCIVALVWQGAAIPQFRPQVTLAGIAIMALGAALRWWAIFILGRYFTFDVAVRAAQPVVRTGPYRLARHPSYTAILIMLLGVGMAMTNWATIAVMLAGRLGGPLARVRVEERALVKALGQPYLDYMRHTKRFIPLIY